MLPPSHAAADIHSLRRNDPPHCGGRSFASHMGERRAPLIICHLEMSISDTQDEVYDLLSWSFDKASLPRLEIEVGVGLWNHHRLGDRFGAENSLRKKSSAGPLLRCSRAFNETQFEKLLASTYLLQLQTLGIQLKSGFAIECEGSKATLFTQTVMSAREPYRWQILLDAARCLDQMLLENLI